MSDDLLHAMRVKIHALLTTGDPINGLPGRDVHLAFCAPGLPLSAADLDFSLRNQASARAAYRFSVLANTLTGASPTWSGDGEALWRIWEQVLTQTVLAQSTLSAAEAAELAARRSSLVVRKRLRTAKGEEERVCDTALYVAYKRLADAYYRMSLKYNYLRITAKYSTAEKDQELWQLNEPIYRESLRRVYGDWQSRGSKNEVEQAIAYIDQVTGRGPGLVWGELKTDLALCERTSPEGHGYYETSVEPGSLFSAGSDAWVDFSVGRDELGIRGEAAAGQVGGDAQLDSAGSAVLDRLSVQLHEAPIRRPWFDLSVFRNRAWKWSRDSGISRPLAAGWPPSGAVLLPTVPTSILFARRLEVHGRGLGGHAEGRIGPFDVAGAATAEETVSSPGVQILAFVCTKLPPSPDPDPALTWQQ